MTDPNMASKGDRLEGRHILVTGAASGIGHAISELFASHGAKLALLDNDAQKIGEVAKGLSAASVVYDLSDPTGAEAMVDNVASEIGGLDGVVNCAGVGVPIAIGDMDMDQVNLFAAVNLLTPYMICKATLPYMREAGSGTIVNIASGQGLLPNAPLNTAYAATKGGLISFSKSLAAEVAPDVRVNAVCPGVTNTPMVAPVIGEYENPSDAPFVQQYAMKRIAEPIEIANAVLFLTSDESSFVTGSALAVDGGRCFH